MCGSVYQAPRKMKFFWSCVVVVASLSRAALAASDEAGLESKLDLLLAIFERESEGEENHWKHMAEFIDDVEKRSHHQPKLEEGDDIVKVNYRTPHVRHHHHHKPLQRRVNSEDDFVQFYHGFHFGKHRRPRSLDNAEISGLDTIAHVLAIEDEVEERSLGEDQLSPLEAAIHAALFESEAQEVHDNVAPSWDTLVNEAVEADSAAAEEEAATEGINLGTALHLAVLAGEIEERSGGSQKLSNWQSALHAAVFENDMADAHEQAQEEEVSAFVDMVMDVAAGDEAEAEAEAESDTFVEDFWSNMEKLNKKGGDMESGLSFSVAPEELKYPLTVTD